MARWLRVIETQSEEYWDFEIPKNGPEYVQKVIELTEGLPNSRIGFGGYVGPAIEVRALSAPPTE